MAAPLCLGPAKHFNPLSPRQWPCAWSDQVLPVSLWPFFLCPTAPHWDSQDWVPRPLSPVLRRPFWSDLMHSRACKQQQRPDGEICLQPGLGPTSRLQLAACLHHFCSQGLPDLAVSACPKQTLDIAPSESPRLSLSRPHCAHSTTPTPGYLTARGSPHPHSQQPGAFCSVCAPPCMSDFHISGNCVFPHQLSCLGIQQAGLGEELRDGASNPGLLSGKC